MTKTIELLKRAKAHQQSINVATSQAKNDALCKMAQALVAATPVILEANQQDLTAAEGKISSVMMDRLRLNEIRIQQMAEGILQVATLPDPIGEIIEETTGAQNIAITKKRVPLGTIGIIYESRPNVTSDAAALCIKSGNAVVLRSGKEAYRSARAIVDAMKQGLAQSDISTECLQLVEDTSRQSAYELMKAKGFLDLLIPRGGAGLIQAVVDEAIVPVIETGTGIVHIYVDKDANQEMALNIIENAKISRPSVCNAAEVCLVHEEIAPTFLPKLQQRIGNRVELRLDYASSRIIPGVAATEEDYDTEFSDYIMSVKIVSDISEAVQHINEHSTHHSEAIVTENDEAANIFTQLVDSAAVYVNASTRFTDGGEFGLGCEMGISTQKLHARGPMGLKELTTYKYIIHGKGQVR